MSVLAGAVSPENLHVIITNAELDPTPLDYTSVAGAYLLVSHGDTGAVVWDATIVSQDAASLELEHVFSPDDVSEAGTYKIVVHMTGSFSGTRRAGPTALEVFAP